MTARIAGFEPRGRAYALLRTTLAAQALIVLVLDPDGRLFPATAANPGGVRCDGVHGAALWCLGGPSASLLPARLVTIVVLLPAMLGWRPRLVGIPHWYVTFSLAMAMPVPVGGDYVAQIATMLLIPVCLGDRRRWHWSPVRAPLAPGWRGAAYAATLVLRLQVTIIYATAGLAKAADGRWRDGSVLAMLSTDPRYGLPGWLRPAGLFLAGHAPLAIGAAWAVIGAEVLLAVAVHGTAGWRRAAFVVGVVLHAGIVVAFGLPTFGAVMIAVLGYACYAGRRTEGAGSGTARCAQGAPVIDAQER
ncbi:exporter of killing factor SpbC [Actinoplanes sp. N902-109]|uniref:exporter of killing factor SpbC n=1 Tax=Actinoplanes sp. (strain N902-109) TaxID=649831 RepID=UPI0003293BAB|nr:exporter of killing factor SpbC [Actinoplanes sp. N902-109]AGL17026.1 exporter of killing factor SpbC [Actinoplanes sp. N902-109]